MNFSERFKQLRKKLNLSQEEIAKELNTGQKTISNWETGRNEPSLEALRTFCSNYNINSNWLLTGQGEMFFNPVSASITFTGESNFTANPTIIKSIDNLTRELQEVKEKLNPPLPPYAIQMKFPAKPILMPLIENIRCGELAELIESGEVISVPPSWEGKGDFCIRVKGHSMKQEGIIDGMIVLIKRITTPITGDIVLISAFGDTSEEINGALKKINYVGKDILLLQNGNGEIIELQQDRNLAIAGKAIAWMKDVN